MILLWIRKEDGLTSPTPGKSTKTVRSFDECQTRDNGGIIIYNYFENRAVRFDHESLHGNPNNVVTIDGVTYTNIQSPSGKLSPPILCFPHPFLQDGIALTPTHLYWCAVSTPGLYSIETPKLNLYYSVGADPSRFVTKIGDKNGLADGLTTDRYQNPTRLAT
jgi:hypothetical protein